MLSRQLKLAWPRSLQAWQLLLALLLLSTFAVSTALSPTLSCTQEVKKCPDGKYVGRDPNKDCEFFRCSSSDPPGPVACTRDAKICPDGTVVGRVAPDCEFAPCPDCNEDAKLCADGSLVGRDITSKCEFFPCKDRCYNDARDCGDGTFVGRDPKNKCKFLTCDLTCCDPFKVQENPRICFEGCQCCGRTGEWVGSFGDAKTFSCAGVVQDSAPYSAPFTEHCGCPDDVMSCKGGSEVGRDENNFCNFFPCPPVGCPRDVHTCDDGTILVRDPENNCEFPDCPDPGPCTLDVFECPDGSFLSRDPKNNCEFPDCPESVVCTADAKMCPDGSFVGRDPNNNCEFKPCGDNCESDAHRCKDGTYVSRDPRNDCRFMSCALKCCDPRERETPFGVCREGCQCCGRTGEWVGSIGDAKTFTCAGITKSGPKYPRPFFKACPDCSTRKKGKKCRQIDHCLWLPGSKTCVREGSTECDKLYKSRDCLSAGCLWKKKDKTCMVDHCLKPDCSAVSCEKPHCEPWDVLGTVPGECCPKCFRKQKCPRKKCPPPKCGKTKAKFKYPGECCEKCVDKCLL